MDVKTSLFTVTVDPVRQVPPLDSTTDINKIFVTETDLTKVEGGLRLFLLKGLFTTGVVQTPETSMKRTRRTHLLGYENREMTKIGLKFRVYLPPLLQFFLHNILLV